MEKQPDEFRYTRESEIKIWRQAFLGSRVKQKATA